MILDNLHVYSSFAVLVCCCASFSIASKKLKILFEAYNEKGYQTHHEEELEGGNIENERRCVETQREVLPQAIFFQGENVEIVIVPMIHLEIFTNYFQLDGSERRKLQDEILDSFYAETRYKNLINSLTSYS